MFRHGYATAMIDIHGMFEACRLLGHSTPASTYIYFGQTPDLERKIRHKNPL